MKKSTQKKMIKAIKKTNKSILVCSILFLLLGLVSGYGTAKYLTRNDTFEIIGDKTITLNLNDTYTDSGAKAIEFNKDINDEIIVEGLEDIDTSKEGKYMIVYRLNSKRYKNIKRVRYVVVKESGDSNE